MAQPQGYKNAQAVWAVPCSMAPGVPQNAALAGGVSVSVTVAKGCRVRISANIAVQYRVTAGADNAAATDNDLPANTPEYITLLSNQDTISFFSAGAGTAKVAVCAGAA